MKDSWLRKAWVTGEYYLRAPRDFPLIDGQSPISPGDGHTSDSISPSDVETSRRPDLTPATAMPLTGVRQIISNARGRFPQLEMVNFPRSPTRQREDQARHVDTLVERLEGVGLDLLSILTIILRGAANTRL